MTTPPRFDAGFALGSWLTDGIARRQLLRRLKGLRGARIVIQDADGPFEVGEGSELSATIQVRNPAFYRKLLFGGNPAAAEAHMNGDWECDDLTSLFRILLRNPHLAGRVDSSLLGLVGLWHRFRHRRRANTKSGSRVNIAAHYDLGNDFFRLWLDETLAYSSAIFLTPSFTLYDASIEKFDRICRKLELKSSDHLLEIGTGWGGFAIHAARNYSCRVTTTTISRQQFELARARISEAGLSGQITLLMQDYRDLSGKFSKLASIEMIEAVGYRNFDTFFRKCSDLLMPD